MELPTERHVRHRRGSLAPKAAVVALAVASSTLLGPVVVANTASTGLRISQYSAESIVEQIDGVATTYTSPGSEHVGGVTGEAGTSTTTTTTSPAQAVTEGSEIPSATNIILTGPPSNLTKMSFTTFFDAQEPKRQAYQAGYDVSLCKRFAGKYAKSWCQTHISAVTAKVPVAGTYTNTYKAAYDSSIKVRLTLTTTKASTVIGAEVKLLITRA